MALQDGIDRWQYHVVNLGSFRSMKRLPKALGELGEQGWELVHVFERSSTDRSFALFKRPVPAGVAAPDEGWCLVDGEPTD